MGPHQLSAEGANKSDWKAKEPTPLLVDGASDGIKPRGKALARKDSCSGRIVRAVVARPSGEGSPGTALAVPSMSCGDDTFKSQNAESIAKRRFAIGLRHRSAAALSLRLLSLVHSAFEARWGFRNLDGPWWALGFAHNSKLWAMQFHSKTIIYKISKVSTSIIIKRIWKKFTHDVFYYNGKLDIQTSPW